MEDLPSQLVTAFLDVVLSAVLATVGVVDVDESQKVEGFGNAAVLGERLPQPRWPPVPTEHPHQVIGANCTSVQGSSHTQHVRPALANAVESGTVAGQTVERPIVGADVKPPEASIGQVLSRDSGVWIVAALPISGRAGPCIHRTIVLI